MLYYSIDYIGYRFTYYKLYYRLGRYIILLCFFMIYSKFGYKNLIESCYVNVI